MTLPRDRFDVWIAPGRDPGEANDIVFPGEWTRVTGFIRYDTGVKISVGRKEEGERVDPTRIEFRLDNADGRFSPRNPESPYYPGLRKNTPLLVTWDRDGAGDFFPMGTGYVSTWRPSRDQSRASSATTVKATGVYRRLLQGSPVLRSAIYREILSPNRTTPIAYWSCEDEDGSTSLASALPGAPAMRISGPADLESNEDIPASAAIPTMNETSFTGPVPPYPDTGEILVRGLFVFPADGAIDGTRLIGMPTSGSANRWSVNYRSGGSIELRVSDDDGNTLEDVAIGFAVDGERISLSLEAVQNGPDIDWLLLVVYIGQTSTSGAQFNGSISGHTIGQVVNVVVNYTKAGDEIAFGHIVFSNDTTIFAGTDQALVGWAGELAGDRLFRLADENGIDLVVDGPIEGEMTMGPQRPISLVELMQECEDADGGILFESINEFGYEYRNRHSIYNQTPILQLAPLAGHIAAPPDPPVDDLGLINDIEVQRIDGSSVRLTDEADIEAHDRYEDSRELNVSDDGVLLDIAGWLLHLGTVDAPRYPLLSLNLARNPSLITDWLEMRVQPGRRLTATYVTPQERDIPIDVLVQGWEELITLDNWTATLFCTPAVGWDVGELDSVELGRLGTDGSELASTYEAGTDTALSVAVTDGPLWGTEDATMQFPFDVVVSGVRVRVIDIVGTSSPQTFAIEQATVNGVTKTVAAGEPVRLYKPLVLAQ